MNIIKGGWHPEGDKQIHRKTWKSDLKNIVTRKDEDTSRAQNHVSAPLSTLKDPDSFGPPPKHSAFYPDAQPARVKGSGTKAITQAGEEEQQKKPTTPFRVDTTGLTTDNLPKPPVRRDVPPTPSSASATSARPVPQIPSAASGTTRPVPAIPPRTGPPPVLPPRQSETPSEFDPPPPPTYGEAITVAPQASAIHRLTQAGVSVPGLGIGSGSAATVQSNPEQLDELQQRFARMKAAKDDGDTTESNTPATPSWKQAQSAYVSAAASPASPISNVQAALGAASQKKKPPPPPVKKIGLGAAEDVSVPPPIPMSSKPRPG